MLLIFERLSEFSLTHQNYSRIEITREPQFKSTEWNGKWKWDNICLHLRVLNISGDTSSKSDGLHSTFLLTTLLKSFKTSLLCRLASVHVTFYQSDVWLNGHHLQLWLPQLCIFPQEVNFSHWFKRIFICVHQKIWCLCPIAVHLTVYCI